MIYIPGTVIEFLKKEEGFRSETYQDIAGVNTIGYGHTGYAAYPGNVINPQRGERLLQEDAQEAAKAVRDLVKVPLDDFQRAALISFAFNLGRGALQSSTLLKKLNAGDYQGAADEFPRWNKARIDGLLTPIPGLTSRRMRERAMFLKKKM